MKKKLIKKIIALTLTVILTVNPLVVPVVWAEGEEISNPPDVLSPTPTDTPPTENTPAPETVESTINSGDAAAVSTTETVVNTNEETLPGEIVAGTGACTPPEGQTECPGETVIANNNEAVVTEETAADAGTGDNETVGTPGDVAITTGDATASGEIKAEVNTNIVELVPTETVSEPTQENQESREEEPALVVLNNNAGEVNNKADISAATGDNMAVDNLGDVKIETGDALALANLLTLLNTNIVGSNFEILFLNITADENGDVDLNQAWKEIQARQSGNGLTLAGENNGLTLRVFNQNGAELTNDVTVAAASGVNEASGNDSVAIDTGNATAVANVANVVNTNIIGAKFFFWMINIISPSGANIILPSPQNFTPLDGGSGSPAIFANQNFAMLNDNVTAAADSGKNEETGNGGNNLMNTGDATAVTNTFSLVNLNLLYNNWFHLGINKLASWNGGIYGWSSSEAVEEMTTTNATFQVGMEHLGETIPEGDSEIEFRNDNDASLQTNIDVSALTGGNKADGNYGDVSIKTGKATALANLLNFVNLNILGGNFFFGTLNIMSDWSGNAIYAFPDVIVALSSGADEVEVGQTLEYSLDYRNQGYETAQNVNLELKLPKGLTYLSDTSGIVPQISGETCTWNLGAMDMGKQGGFKITVRVNDDFSFDEQISFLSRLIPQVQAESEEKDKEVTITAAIYTPDPESNSSNNVSSSQTVVYEPAQETSEEEPKGDPQLEISAWNNVGQYVYQGDTITFEVTVKNTGVTTAYNVTFVQKLYNGVPGSLGTMAFKLGDLEPGQGGKLSFGLTVPDGLVVDHENYHTIALAYGENRDGDEFTSNEARTDFKIKFQALKSLFTARAKEEESAGQVLSNIVNECNEKESSILPYVLSFILSSLWLVDRGKKAFGYKK